MITGAKAQAYIDARWERENCNGWWATKQLTETVFGLDGIALGCTGSARKYMTKLITSTNLPKVRTNMRQSGLNVIRVKRNPYGKRKVKCSKPSENSLAANTPTTHGLRPTGKPARPMLPVSNAANHSVMTSTECR